MNQKEYPHWHEDFIEALSFTARLHVLQMRKDTNIPYISHLMAVAGIVMENGGDRDQTIAALLHDAIEDQSEQFPGGADALRQEIKNKFGDRVLEIVEQCTDADIIPKPPWRQRKEAYIAHLEHVGESTLLVSCADKLHNVRTIVSDLRVIGDALWSRFKGGKDGSIWYYEALTQVFLQRGPQKLAQELQLTVTEMAKLASD